VEFPRPAMPYNLPRTGALNAPKPRPVVGLPRNSSRLFWGSNRKSLPSGKVHTAMNFDLFLFGQRFEVHGTEVLGPQIKGPQEITHKIGDSAPYERILGAAGDTGEMNVEFLLERTHLGEILIVQHPASVPVKCAYAMSTNGHLGRGLTCWLGYG